MKNIKIKHSLKESSGVPDLGLGKYGCKEMNKAMNVFLNKNGLKTGGWQAKNKFNKMEKK